MQTHVVRNLLKATVRSLRAQKFETEMRVHRIQSKNDVLYHCEIANYVFVDLVGLSSETGFG